MAEEFAAKAKEAFVEDDFDVAVEFYSKAIDLDPNRAVFFADRSQAYIKLDKFTEAVADANEAIELDPSLTKAYIRNGTAYMKLGEYQTAKAALEKGALIAPNDSKFKKLMDECDLRIAEEERYLVQPPLSQFRLTPMLSSLPSSSTTPSLVSELDLIPVAAAKAKYRHEYYQKPEEVVVTVFAKGMQKQNVNVDFGEQILSVVIDVPGEETYNLQPRLFGKIIPEKCRYEVMSTKVEIRLAKADIITWSSLEYSKVATVLSRLNVLSEEITKRPSYPSSKKAKYWDKLVAEVKKEEMYEMDDPNQVLRGMYMSCDEDGRRAMSKSYMESNGTVLSSDWKKVGKKRIESETPDGMALKKWEF
ncbi:unnamed protein product [Cochlearia groenlandica]